MGLSKNSKHESKKKIRAPKTGYNFEEKNKYRHKVWSTFAEKLDTDTAVILFLPSNEGLEIPIALSYGFKEENLIAVDDCPAVIATSKWRKKYPKIKFYGNILSRACVRMEENGIFIDGAILDLCGNISKPMIAETKAFFKSNIFYGYSIFSLTMLSGRESAAINTLAELYIESNIDHGRCSEFDKRIQIICALIESGIRHSESSLKYTYQAYYKSGNLKMVYGIFERMTQGYVSNFVELKINNMKKINKKVSNYLKIQKEHYELRVFWGEVFCGSDKYKQDQKKYAHQADDIYSIWLKAEKIKIENMLHRHIYKYLEGFGYREYAGTIVYGSGHYWHDFFDINNMFYTGVKRVFKYYENEKKAIKYLDSINWDIRR